ncbi:MAG: DUF4236 domain-containing protein, partial [Rickettsiales bacterium]|nr:DUF4236 domain-containing protein [Rickettsiales bacterium]
PIKMGLKLRKIVPIAKLLKLNFSKSGASLTFGKKGSAINISKDGVRASIGKVGSGIGYSEYFSFKKLKLNYVFIGVALIAILLIIFTS